MTCILDLNHVLVYSYFKQIHKNSLYLFKMPITTAFEDQIKKCLYRRTLPYFSGNTATLEKSSKKIFPS